MRNVIYIILASALIGCGNASHTNQDADYADSFMVTTDTIDTVAVSPTREVPTPSEEKEAESAPMPVTTSNSTLYDEGYHQGYADGEEDGYTHSGYQASFDSSNRYSGKAAYDYEDGYENGYEDGYNDNVESDEEE